MNCKELIELYNKVGGVLTCNYLTNRVTVANTNLECVFNSSNYYDLECLSHTFAFSPYRMDFLENKQINMIDKLGKKPNRFLSPNEYGFVISFLNN